MKLQHGLNATSHVSFLL